MRISTLPQIAAICGLAVLIHSPAMAKDDLSKPVITTEVRKNDKGKDVI
jgi:hypothetical protein